MRNPSLHLSVIAVILFSALRAAASLAEKETAAPQELESLKKAIQDVLSAQKVPGAGVALVTKDGVAWAGGLGKADVAAGKDVTADTLFRAGSITKSFVSLALIKLAEEGKLNLEARVRDIAPEIQIDNPWEDSFPVRVVNLLEHTAGFDDMHYNEIYNLYDPTDISLRNVLAINPHSRRARWPPSMRMSYSNPGYAVAGYVIEKVTGRLYDDYIRDAILRPLGMSSTSFRLDRGTKALLAQGYYDASIRPATLYDIYLRPAGSLSISARELGIFVQMLLGRGKAGQTGIVSAQSIDRMEQPKTTFAARAGFKGGYGLGNYYQVDGPSTFHGHGGGIEGFISNYGYSPQAGVGYVVLLNSTVSGKAMEDICALVIRHLLRDMKLPEKPSTKLSEAQLRRLEGYYEARAPRNQALAFMDNLLDGKTVYVQNGVLYQKTLLDKPVALIPVTENSFRREKDSQASVLFIPADTGATVLTGLEGYAERVNPWPSRVRLLLLGTALALMISSVAFAPVWLVLKLFGRLRGDRHLMVRILPLCAVLALAGSVAVLVKTPIPQMGTFNLRTAGFCALTWTFAGLSLLGVLLALRDIRWHTHRAARIHSLLVSLACCGVAVYLYFWHLLGLRLWAW